MKVYFEIDELKVREWTDSDIGMLVDGMNSLAIAKGFGTRYPYTREEGEKYLKKVKCRTDTKGIYFAIEKKVSRFVIGGGGIYYKNNQYAIGIWICEEEQKKGYGSRVLAGVIKYAFEVLKVENIFFYFYSGNMASEKLAIHCGFRILENKIKYVDGEKKTRFTAVIDRKQYFRIYGNV